MGAVRRSAEDRAQPARHSPRNAKRKTLPTFAVILAGGRSTRFWPLARRALPKQLLRLHGRGTLLQQTAQRLRRVAPWSRLLVVTTHEYAPQIQSQLPHLPPEHILVEPQGRGTGPCLTLVAEWVRSRIGDAILVATPADHRVDDVKEFSKDLTRAIGAARSGKHLVALGAQPTHAETGYGYLQAGERISRTTLRRVRRFREKPSASLARRLVQNPAYLWNTGIFVWQASTFLQAVEQELPKVATALAGVWQDPVTAASRIRRAYGKIDSVSVDVGVLEPLSQRRDPMPDLLVQPTHFDWSDIGTWSAMGDVWVADAQGNSSVGKMLALDASGCVVHAPKHTVVALGVKDLVVVEADGALLICPRSRAQEVRRIVDELSQRGMHRLI